MIALRRAVAGSARAQPIAYWGGFAILALALVLELGGVWIGAAICFPVSIGALWLAGAWVLPWGPDAYLRRLVRAFDSWSASSQVAYGTADRVAARLTPPSAPARFAAEHERVAALEAEAHIGRTSGETYAERTRAAVAAVRALDELSGTLTGSAADDAERAYAAEVVTRMTRRREAYATATRNAQRGGEDMLARLQRTVPPTAATGEHTALVAALRAELDARGALIDAIDALDADGAERAARTWEERRDALTAGWLALMRRLGAAERWPVEET